MDFDWKGLLGQVAPVLGTAIGGPFGALAGIAIKAALGLAPDTDEAAMQKALATATPEQLLAIKAANNQFVKDMRALDVDVLKIDADDRNSARQREASLRDWIPGTLAVIVTLAFFGLLAWLMAKEPPTGSKDILNIMLGALGAAWTAIVSYYFGSSAGSQSKDYLLFKSTPVASK